MNSLCDADEDKGEMSSLLGKFDNDGGAWGRALAEVRLQEAAQQGEAAGSLFSDLGGRRPGAAGGGRTAAAPATAFAAHELLWLWSSTFVMYLRKSTFSWSAPLLAAVRAALAADGFD